MCSLEALCRLAVTLALVGGSPELQCLHYKLSDALLWSYHWSQRRKHRRRRMLQAPGKRSKLKEKILFLQENPLLTLMRYVNWDELFNVFWVFFTWKKQQVKSEYSRARNSRSYSSGLGLLCWDPKGEEPRNVPMSVSSVTPSSVTGSGITVLLLGEIMGLKASARAPIR